MDEPNENKKNKCHPKLADLALYSYGLVYPYPPFLDKSLSFYHKVYDIVILNFLVFHSTIFNHLVYNLDLTISPRVSKQRHPTLASRQTWLNG